MPFPVTCPSCRHTSQVPDSLAGTTARCPMCGVVVDLPDPEPKKPPVVPVKKTTAAQSVTSTPEKVPTRPPAEEDVPLVFPVKDEPTGKKKKGANKKKSKALPLLLVVGGVLLLFCCGGGGVGGYFIYPLIVHKDKTTVENSTADQNQQQPAAANSGGSSRPNSGEATKPKSPDVDEDKAPASYWIDVLRSDDDKAQRASSRLYDMGQKALPDLKKAAGDKDGKVRLAAVTILGQLGDLAQDAKFELGNALNDAEAAVRVAAAEALGKIGPSARAVYPQIIRAASDPHPQVREAVSNSLRKIGPPGKDDVKTLAELLKEKNPDKRVAYAGTIRDLKPESAALVELFKPLVNDSEKPMKIQAIKALGEAGPPAHAQTFPVLLPFLEDYESDVRQAALASIAAAGPPTTADIPALQLTLFSKQVEARRYAAEAIGNLGDEGKTCAALLAGKLKDDDVGVRQAAAAGLVKLGAAAKDVRDNLLAARTDADPKVRQTVLQALGACGRGDGVVDGLFASLNDEEEPVRAAAMKTLRELKPPLGKDDLTNLSSALKDKAADARRFAAAELTKIGAEALPVRSSLIDALKDADGEVQKQAAMALGAMGPQAKEAVPALLALMTASLDSTEAGSKERFQQASAAVMKIGSAADAIPMIQKGLRSKNNELRKELLQGIADMGPDAKALVGDLAALLSDAENREQASAALVKMAKDPMIGIEAVKPVVRVLETEKDKDARLAAIHTLGAMGTDTRGYATVVLNQASKGKGDPEIRAAAADALKKVQKKGS
ncbi:MAG TPA: HEAT repeat domain-containing protein [Gemmataceae bacterium]|nr:HEAT repeat domain-containing protein [Gemmataceae bacterium]